MHHRAFYDLNREKAKERLSRLRKALRVPESIGCERVSDDVNASSNRQSTIDELQATADRLSAELRNHMEEKCALLFRVEQQKINAAELKKTHLETLHKKVRSV